MESCKWLKTCVFSAENLRLRTPVCGILETTFIISMLHTNSRLYGGHKKSGAINNRMGRSTCSRKSFCSIIFGIYLFIISNWVNRYVALKICMGL